ncbi:MAG: hypothetical protein A2087_11810 [Spirochaetes bacterium GWD1_61_31]|nr:MAG: hypothetical protein A2Y37_04685 [Spirochaetes bacterium GWB1_60_80]OHD34782.1 MAG: hypothetical protein A2004_08685 [Spirochaetes bacterium GWC1_61_12]OHD41720.1 MAG: hypothetical protein A2087_11810 [Spirochaetes bacterium GWD1_61_31]OHD44614.1 MAG: hypothetical protein A2Y35_12005 [Spirochaetes bacterium GWE1_60_18]OHD57939.1 MAG: hypothetical protein A2Y32_04000 [Spirochaetes bacterium GWF1_60_12]HAP43935.1 hypothetical protein [Spirochaetaceae bacterium]
MKSGRWLLAAWLLSLLAQPLAATDDMASRGLDLFMSNKPAEAVPLLELASRQAGVDETVFLYLGIACLQLTRFDEALTAFRRGLTVAVVNQHLFHFNIGNAFFMQNRNSFALESYNQAISSNQNYAPAYLNRANVQMRLGDTAAAVSDYGYYLALDPTSLQAPEIRRLVDLLTSRIADAAQVEALRQAQAQAEEQARAAMQAAVTQSLLDAAATTTNLSAGSGDVEGYEDDLSLDD